MNTDFQVFTQIEGHEFVFSLVEKTLVVLENDRVISSHSVNWDNNLVQMEKAANEITARILEVVATPHLLIGGIQGNKDLLKFYLLIMGIVNLFFTTAQVQGN